MMSDEGFHEDCSRNSTDFQLFCDDWKQKGFHFVFHFHAYQHELLLYTENCFIILKNVFTSSTSITERLATLYLMYAMYFKQPTKDFCKFRFTIQDWSKMKHFYDGISVESKYLQARAVFWRLWQANAFRFVECDREHYPETMQLHRTGNDGTGNFQKINSTIISSVNDLQNQSNVLLGAIETLQVGYNEMKDHFATNLSDCSNLQCTNVIESVHSHMNQIKKLFETKFDASGGRRKDKSTKTNHTRSKKVVESDTDIESELNETAFSYSGSNDASTSYSAHDGDNDDNDENASDECLNIESKRYNLKRRALQDETVGLRRLRSTVFPECSPTKPSQKTTKDKQNLPATPNKPNELQQNPISIIDDGGCIIISHQRKIYNRHSKECKSSIQKQFIDYPPEASHEIDPISPRKRGRRKEQPTHVVDKKVL